jgi:hypothetical protein
LKSSIFTSHSLLQASPFPVLPIFSKMITIQFTPAATNIETGQKTDEVNSSHGPAKLFNDVPN